MKKILLGLLSLPILIIGFSEAWSVSCQKNYCDWVWGYAWVIWSRTAYCFDYWDAVWLNVSLTSEYCEDIRIWNWDITRFIGCTKYPLINPFIEDWKICFTTSSSIPTWKSVKLSVDFEYPPEATLVPWWVSAFSWVVSSLVSSVGEFIPYVSYIWLWILGAVIWFFAIKRLIVRIRKKIFWSFKS